MTEPKFDLCENLKLYDRNRFDDPANATALVQLYAPLNLWSTSYSLLYRELQTYELDSPVWVAMNSGSITWPESIATASSSTITENCMNLSISSHTVQIDNAHFLIISTPLTDANLSANYGDSRHRLETVASTIALHFGINFAPKHAIEIAVNIDNGTVADVPQSRRLPRVTDGPYLDPNKWDELNDTLTQLRSKTDPNRIRIERSLVIFRNAQHIEEGFIYYWISLETLCGTYQLKSKLQQCYKLSDTSAVEDLFKVGMMKELRNDLVHEGARYNISGDVERFVQVMYLDLLRFELGLTHLGYMQRLKNTPGVNLEQIGI